MKLDRELEPNVLEFLKKTSKIHGDRYKDRFFNFYEFNSIEVGCQSPIEDIFFIAIKLFAEDYCSEGNEQDGFYDEVKGEWVKHGFFIHSQSKIGNYKVDFLIENYPINGKGESVIVELDGHDFHDKDKHQRSYEKKRDRFFAKNGFKVLHYTGSDVVNDPYGIAAEVLSAVGFNFDEEILEKIS